MDVIHEFIPSPNTAEDGEKNYLRYYVVVRSRATGDTTLDSLIVLSARERLLLTSDHEKSPEMKQPGMERIEPSEPGLREAASWVETRQEEKDQDKEFYDFLDKVQDFEMKVDNRVAKREP